MLLDPKSNPLITAEVCNTFTALQSGIGQSEANSNIYGSQSEIITYIKIKETKAKIINSNAIKKHQQNTCDDNKYKKAHKASQHNAKQCL